MLKFFVLVVLAGLCPLTSGCCTIGNSRWAQKPVGGISPCLIPPLENLIYRIEAPLIGRPEVRTGCWSQRDDQGTPFPQLSFSVITTVKTHWFFVIEATGRQVSVRPDRSVQIQVQEEMGNQTTLVRKTFQFKHLCFPEFCYNNKDEYMENCFYPFTGGGCIPELADCDHIEKVKKESRGKHLGKSDVFGQVEWLYCKERDGEPLKPLLTPDFPLGQLEKLHQIHEFQGLKDKLRIEYRYTLTREDSEDGETFDLTAGCEVALLLEPPFNKYVKRLFYVNQNRPTSIPTIQKGDTVSIIKTRLNPSSTCKEPHPLLSLLPKEPCDKYQRRSTNSTYDEICFPKQCQLSQDQQPKGRGCIGGRRKYLRYTLAHNTFRSKLETIVRSRGWGNVVPDDVDFEANSDSKKQQ